MRLEHRPVQVLLRRGKQVDLTAHLPASKRRPLPGVEQTWTCLAGQEGPHEIDPISWKQDARVDRKIRRGVPERAADGISVDDAPDKDGRPPEQLARLTDLPRADQVTNATTADRRTGRDDQRDSDDRKAKASADQAEKREIPLPSLPKSERLSHHHGSPGKPADQDVADERFRLKVADLCEVRPLNAVGPREEQVLLCGSGEKKAWPSLSLGKLARRDVERIGDRRKTPLTRHASGSRQNGLVTEVHSVERPHRDNGTGHAIYPRACRLK